MECSVIEIPLQGQMIFEVNLRLMYQKEKSNGTSKSHGNKACCHELLSQNKVDIKLQWTRWEKVGLEKVIQGNMALLPI